LGKKIYFFGKKITFGEKIVKKYYLWEKISFCGKKNTVSQIFTPGRTLPPFSHMSIARESGSPIRPRSQFKGGGRRWAKQPRKGERMETTPKGDNFRQTGEGEETARGEGFCFSPRGGGFRRHPPKRVGGAPEVSGYPPTHPAPPPGGH